MKPPVTPEGFLIQKLQRLASEMGITLDSVECRQNFDTKNYLLRASSGTAEGEVWIGHLEVEDYQAKLGSTKPKVDAKLSSLLNHIIGTCQPLNYPSVGCAPD